MALLSISVSSGLRSVWPGGQHVRLAHACTGTRRPGRCQCHLGYGPRMPTVHGIL